MTMKLKGGGSKFSTNKRITNLAGYEKKTIIGPHSPMARHKKYYKGEGDGFPQV
jgi:hypothetical protein